MKLRELLETNDLVQSFKDEIKSTDIKDLNTLQKKLSKAFSDKLIVSSDYEELSADIGRKQTPFNYKK